MNHEILSVQSGGKRRKQESIFKAGAWTYILYNLQSTNYVFRQIIFPAPGESKFFQFLFCAEVTKMGAESHP